MASKDHQTGDSVELEVHLPHNVCIVCLYTTSHRVDGEIHLPREGRVNLRTGDGSIQFSNFRGNMDLQSSDGDQDIDSVDGEVRALAGSTISSNWDLHAGDGKSVTLQLPQASAADVDLHTDDGYISLAAGTC